MPDGPQIWLKKTNKPPKKSAVSYRGHHFSPKTQSYHFGDSLNEHYFCHHLDFEQSIPDYRSHPATFGYIDAEGKERQYTPDKLLITTTGQWIFVEVKPFKQWVKIKWQVKLKYLQGLFYSIDCHFIVVLDRSIRREPLLSNLRLINAYAYLDLTGESIREVVDLVSTKPGIELSELCQRIKSSSTPAAAIYKMLYHHHLACDLNKDLSRTTRIYLCERTS